MKKCLLSIAYQAGSTLLGGALFIYPSLLLANPLVEGSVGIASADSQYKTTSLATLSVGYERNRWVLLAGLTKFDDFELKSRDARTYIETEGVYLKAMHRSTVGAFELEYGLGLMQTKSQAYFLNREVGDDSSTSPILVMRGLLPVGYTWSFFAEWNYINDISGIDVNTISTGARLSF